VYRLGVAALRIYCETLPFEEVTRDRTVGLLARYGLEIVLAVRPWQLAELPRVAGVLGGAGVPLSVWPMLADDEGRWANARNAKAFVAFAERTVDVLGRAGLPPRELLFDLEPDFSEVRMLSPGVDRSGLLGAARARSAPHSAAFVHGERVLAAAVDALHARGIATSSAVWPVVALDPPGGRAWQTLLGTPVDGLATHRVSVMVYTSMLEGWSRGTLRRHHARALLAAAARRVVRRFGERASLSLGCVGTGAFEDEPVFRGPSELAEDVAIARAAGCEDLSLFDLGGVLRRERGEGAVPAEAWLDAFTSAGREEPGGIGVASSRRVDAARTLARAATWALARRAKT
jgi:hypothetical protein